MAEGSRGRQKGQTKDVLVINDPLFKNYEIHEDKLGYTLIEINPNNTSVVGYFSSLGPLINNMVHCCMVDEKGTYTLREYVNEYKQSIEEFKKVLGI